MFSSRDYARALEPLLAQAGGYARSILRNRADAQDAVQAAALRGLERLDSYDPARPFKAWWFAILRNGCRDRLRDARRHPVQALHPVRHRDVADDRAASTGTDTDPGTSPEPDWEALDRALATLSDDHHEIIRLRYFAGLSYAEIAAVLAIPAGTVMSRLHHARRAVAARLHEDQP